jgi:hypothetical protein
MPLAVISAPESPFCQVLVPPSFLKPYSLNQLLLALRPATLEALCACVEYHQLAMAASLSL